MASDNEESLARRLWASVRSESVVALYTPFVVALAAGNLEAETLRNCFSQVLYFIKCYAQSLEFVEKCAENYDAKNSVSQFKNIFLKHLEDYNSLVKRWGSNYSKEYTVNPATVKCTKFVYAMATGKWASPSEKAKVGAYTLGAMMPHIQLYAFIGKELQSLLDANGSSHPYTRWIDHYSCKYYQDYTLQAEDLLDKLSVSLAGKDLDMLQKFYHQAMILELEFFSVQPMVQKTVVPLLKEHNPSEHHFMVFSDFDLTCTTVDSSASLAEFEIKREPESDQVQSQIQIDSMPSADPRNSWGLFAREYTEEFEQCIVKILTTEYEQCLLKILIADYERRIKNISLADDGTIVNTDEYELFSVEGTIVNTEEYELFSVEGKKFNHTVLKKAIEKLSEFQRRADTGVIESENINAGLRHTLQDSCLIFFQSIAKNENISASIHVLSYRWCYDLMKSVFSSANLHTLSIHENEVIYEECVSTGEIIRKVESPIDRVERFGNIRHNSAIGKKKLVVYIGQSIGDLLCLLEADIGIVIDPSESLRRVGSHFGVSFVPLFPVLVQKQKEMVEGSSFNWTGGLSGVLYTVSSWDEVIFLFVGV